MRVWLLIWCVLFFCIAPAVGQQEKKSAKLYNAALKSYSRWDKKDAFQKMEKAIALSPQSPYGYSQLGEWYFLQHYFSEAAQVFQRASSNCKDGYKQFARPLAVSLLHCGMGDSALRIINRYATSKDSVVWEPLRKQALFIRANQNTHPNQPKPQWLGAGINSKYPETFPVFDGKDSMHLYFIRKHNNTDQDVFCSTFDSCSDWALARNHEHALEYVNTIANEESPYVSADGHYLFFGRTDNRSDNGWEQGGTDLYMAYRVSVDSEWTMASPFHATINTPDCETMPSLSADNRQLYFVSDRAGGYGGKDIWVTTFENYKWQKPKNAGPQINTPADETAPHICNDNRTLLFTSNGHVGFGGKDIFVARKIKDTQFTTATNLGYPINTAHNEESEWLDKTGKQMYFASDRQGPAGNFDLYKTSLPMHLSPEITCHLHGYAYDSISRDKLNSTYIFITDAHNGDTVYQLLTNRGDGTYDIPLPIDKTYALHTSRVKYTEKDDTLRLDSTSTNIEREYNICMLASDYREPIRDSLLATIHFEKNRVELSDSDKQHIYRGIEPFLLDKGIIVYVNGYTDNTGNPLINEELSTKRANQIADVLIGYGIEELLIIAKGWGEANTIASNDTEEGQRINRRVEIVLKRE